MKKKFLVPYETWMIVFEQIKRWQAYAYVASRSLIWLAVEKWWCMENQLSSWLQELT